MTAPRADARRNRETVLRTAVEVFAEDGLEVSLSRIARRAGVGAGTVYRHFPSKEILVEAVLADHVERMVVAADRWATQAAPGEALFGFLVEVIEKFAGRQAFCDALTADRSWPRATLGAAVQRFHDALDHLLAKAKQAGTIRPDLHTDDLTAFTVAGAALRAAHQNRARATRVVRMLLDGLRVTKPALSDTIEASRHETCAECGTPLNVRPTGRPARYCGPTCRQRAHRRSG